MADEYDSKKNLPVSSVSGYDNKETDPRDAKPPVDRQKAVAIEYNADEDPAPRITASGQGNVAEQILAIAFANGVKVREDADLVEILSVLEVDSVIPLEAYAAVGEILSYVYKANARMAKMPKE